MKKKFALKGRYSLMWVSVLTFIVAISIIYNINVKTEIDESYEKEPKDDRLVEGKFHPDELTPERYAQYLAWKDKLKETGNNFKQVNQFFSPKKGLKTIINPMGSLKSAPSSSYSYASGALTGVWQQKSFMNGGGYRVDGSVYDPVNEDIYAISYAGHLYKIDKSAANMWTLRNHSMSFLGRAVSGVNLQDGSFRLLYQKKNGGMMYSDDEGRSWQTANGALFENGWNHSTIVAPYYGASNKRIVAHGSNYQGSNGYHRIYMSTDYGLNYSESSFSWPRADYDVILCKVYNKERIYALVRNKSTQRISIYRLKSGQDEFTLVRETSQSFSSLTKAFCTYANGNDHFYVHAGAANIFYSEDGGVSWTQTANNNDKNIKAIHPTQPNICYKGFVQVKMSKDYGATWETNKHNLGKYYTWDLQHMNVYEKEDGTDVMLAGLDFGFYYSEAPEDWDSWETLNVGSLAPMCYDAVTSDINNVGYMACQDKGARGYVDNGGSNGEYDTKGVASTDVLRVALAKNETSVWYWYYYGKIERSDVNADASGSNKKGKDPFSNWWASTMVGSPDQSEDAVYIATGNQLNKFTYNSVENKVNRTLHPFVFSGDIHSFGYSNLNTNRWYVGLKSGPLMYSTDGGNSFTQSSYTGTWPGQENSYKKTRPVILCSPVDEATVYYAGKGNRFLISTDGGQAFTNHARGLDISRFRDFDVTPNGKYIFGACAMAGAWVFSVEDDRWYELTANELPYVDYTDVQYIPSKNIARFATYGSGIIDFVVDQDLVATQQTTYNAYYITQKSSGYKLSSNGSDAVLVNSSITDDNVKWIMLDAGSGNYYFENVADGKRLKCNKYNKC